MLINVLFFLIKENNITLSKTNHPQLIKSKFIIQIN